MHIEEYHVTVKGSSADDVLRWRHTCAAIGVKPLWIELSTFERQLMCASKWDCAREITAHGWTIERIKHEVPPTALAVAFFKVQYYECHVKFDGIFRPNFPMASRDLLRENRWYSTLRMVEAFDPQYFIAGVSKRALISDGWRGTSQYAGHEYEVAILDTNRDLDRHWSSNGR